jgi:hypothetical protein
LIGEDVILIQEEKDTINRIILHISFGLMMTTLGMKSLEQLVESKNVLADEELVEVIQLGDH